MPDIDPTTLTDEQLRELLREAGRRSSAKRRRTDRACEACGATMTNVTTRRRYCSGACKVRAHYWKQRAETDPAAAHRLRLQAKGWLPATSKGE